MSHGHHDVSRRSRRLTDVTTSHGRHDVSRTTDVTTSCGRHDVSRTSRPTDVTTSHGRHDVSRTSRRRTDATTSHGRHDVSSTSRRLTDVNDVSRRSRCLTDVATSHGRHDVSWRSRRLTDVTTSHGRHDVSRTSRTFHGRHDVSRTSRRLTEVTTSHGGHDVSRRSRRLTEVTTSLGRHVEGCAYVGGPVISAIGWVVGETNSPTLALEPKWRTRHSAQGKVLQSQGPSQPSIRDSYQYLQPDEDLWISNLHWTLGFPGPRWMHAPSLPSRSVRIVPMFVSGHCVHPNVPGPWSVIGLLGWTPRVAIPRLLLADVATQGGGHCKTAGRCQRHTSLATRSTDDAPQAAPVHVGASSSEHSGHR